MNVKLPETVDPRPYYELFFDEVGELRIPEALSAFDLLGLPANLRDIVRDGRLSEWKLPCWFMPFRSITDWEFEALTQGRTIGMRVDKILVSASISVPILDSYLFAGTEALNRGEASIYGDLALEWNTSKYRMQQKAMMKLAKENPIQFLKRTDTEGDWDDKEHLRSLQYKADLDKQVEEKPVQIKFDFDG